MNQVTFQGKLNAYIIEHTVMETYGNRDDCNFAHLRKINDRVEGIKTEILDAYAAALERIAELEAQVALTSKPDAYDDANADMFAGWEGYDKERYREMSPVEMFDMVRHLESRIIERDAELEAQLAQREWEPVEDTDVIDCQCVEDECGNIWYMEQGLFVAEDGDTGYRISVDLGDDYALCRRVKGDA